MSAPPNHDAATAIARSLQQQSLKHWGFVIFRCTYRSQEKWDRLLAHIQQHAREQFAACGMAEVYETAATWTLFEDAAALEGAGLAETSRRFSEWVWADDGGQREMEGRSVLKGNWVYCPRYFFYLHVDEEGLESVVDGDGEGEQGWVRAVRADIVLTREDRLKSAREKGEEEEEEEDEYEMLDLRKKVVIDEIVDLYAALLSIDRWYNILTEDGVCQI